MAPLVGLAPTDTGLKGQPHDGLAFRGIKAPGRGLAPRSFRLTGERITLILAWNTSGRGNTTRTCLCPGPRPGASASSASPRQSGGRRRAFSPNLFRGSTRFQDGVPQRSTSPSIKWHPYQGSHLDRQFRRLGLCLLSYRDKNGGAENRTPSLNLARIGRHYGCHPQKWHRPPGLPPGSPALQVRRSCN